MAGDFAHLNEAQSLRQIQGFDIVRPDDTSKVLVVPLVERDLERLDQQRAGESLMVIVHCMERTAGVLEVIEPEGGHDLPIEFSGNAVELFRDGEP